MWSHLPSQDFSGLQSDLFKGNEDTCSLVLITLEEWLGQISEKKIEKINRLKNFPNMGKVNY